MSLFPVTLTSQAISVYRTTFKTTITAPITFDDPPTTYDEGVYFLRTPVTVYTVFPTVASYPPATPPETSSLSLTSTPAAVPSLLAAASSITSTPTTASPSFTPSSTASSTATKVGLGVGLGLGIPLLLLLVAVAAFLLLRRHRRREAYALTALDDDPVHTGGSTDTTAEKQLSTGSLKDPLPIDRGGASPIELQGDNETPRPKELPGDLSSRRTELP
ncbi:MAG: hypothetical protein Q9222_007300 [Ikaeria aurantiellina]